MPVTNLCNSQPIWNRYLWLNAKECVFGNGPNMSQRPQCTLAEVLHNDCLQLIDIPESAFVHFDSQLLFSFQCLMESPPNNLLVLKCWFQNLLMRKISPTQQLYSISFHYCLLSAECYSLKLNFTTYSWYINLSLSCMEHQRMPILQEHKSMKYSFPQKQKYQSSNGLCGLNEHPNTGHNEKGVVFQIFWSLWASKDLNELCFQLQSL